MNDSIKAEFSSFDPIRIVYHEDDYVMLYFKESRIYSELREVLNDLTQSFFSEVVVNSASVPVIITDSTRQNIIEYGNIDSTKLADSLAIAEFIDDMAGENDPIKIELPELGTNYIFYKDSALLVQIRYYPFIQFTVIGVFLLISYVLFSTARKSEQNLVWIGMSKETAHQIGTPLSSIMAWIELLKMKGIKEEGIEEMEKDVKRLENITDRFSKIGSPAKLEPLNIVELIYESVDYLRPRISKKIKISVNLGPEKEILVPLNSHLFEWVIENICKNSVDAMNGTGEININISEEPTHVIVDIEDTGKGIQKSHFKSVFSPGYTSKKRGWGLGLSLSKRIIENYHKGKIFVKSSVLGQGTVVRIIFRKK
jgi:anti-sigma regulatory factor (Ser/Thr protein kinase)